MWEPFSFAACHVVPWRALEKDMDKGVGFRYDDAGVTVIPVPGWRNWQTQRT